MGSSDLMHRFDVDLKLVSKYLNMLAPHPDGSFIVLDEAAATPLSGVSKGDGVPQGYLATVLKRRTEPFFAKTPPCVILTKRTRNGGDPCLAVTFYRQGFEQGKPVMKGDPGLLSSNAIDCAYYFEDHASLSGVRYEDDLSRYGDAMRYGTLNTVLELSDCDGNQYNDYWRRQSELRYKGIEDYLASGRPIQEH